MANEDVVVTLTPEIFGAMQSKRPYRAYRKTILARVYLTILDPFTMKPTGVILQGDPRRGDKGCIVEVWSETEDLFLHRMNERQFEQGTIVKYVKPENVVEERTISQFSDEELKALINQKYAALQVTLSKINDIAPLVRLLDLSESEDKSERIVNSIKARLSAVQEKELTGEK